MEGSSVGWQPVPEGLLFTRPSDSLSADFPLDPHEGSTAPPLLRALEQLWADELVVEHPEGLLLEWDTVYELGDDLPRAIGLPTPQEFEVELRSKSYAGRDDFEVQAHISAPGGGLIPPDSRIGPLIMGDRRNRLVQADLWRLLKVVDAVPTDLSGQLLAIGQIKDAAKDCGAQLDEFLASQDIVTAGGIRLEIKGVSAEHLELHPIPASPEAEDFEDDVTTSSPRSAYTKKDGLRRRRLVLDADEKAAVRGIRERGEIRGSDVPKFLDNPEAFLPDSVDLSQFSPRVVGLIPQRYQSQPYVSLAPTKERDWFNTDIGVDLSPSGIAAAPPTPSPAEEGTAGVPEPAGPDEEEGPGESPAPTPPGIQPEEYAELCRQVQATDDPNVLHDDTWIEIEPREAERFLRLWDDIEHSPDGTRRIHRKTTGYLLDVISNVDELEFGLEGREPATTLPELPYYEPPESLAATLQEHQVVGYRWMRYLAEESLGGLLADDMGLGKTVQLIGLLAHLKDQDDLGPALIVVPSAVLYNWQSEIRRFCPSVGYIVIHQGSGRSKRAEELSTAEVVLTTYETLRRDQLILGRIDWSVVVCDEAQKVKNPTAQSTSAVKAMKAPFRFALTGTPVENGLSELWCIVDFAQPGKLGSRREFRDDFEKPINEAEGDARFELAKRLQRRLSPHYLRRTKNDVADLPAKEEKRIPVGVGQRQLRLYSDFIQKVHSGDMIPIAALTKLIQVLSHPEAVEPSDRRPDKLIEECPKLAATLDIVSDIQQRHEKVLIFTRYRDMQDILQRALAHRFGIHARIINGTITSSRRRLDLVDAFNASDGFQAMILSPEAAGVGLNITGANHVIHYSRLWNPAKENQATDRVHRIGQKRPVTVYYPIVTSDAHPTVEEKLDELLEEKRDLARSVLWPRSRLSVDRELKDFISGEAQA